jgi:hypothetical protein
MSLVNDVLRQLNDHQTAPEHSMPLQTLQASRVKQNKRVLQKLIVFLGVSLGIILILQLLYKKPLNQLIYSQNFKKVSHVDSLSSGQLSIKKSEANKAIIKLSRIEENSPLSIKSAAVKERTAFLELDSVEPKPIEKKSMESADIKKKQLIESNGATFGRRENDKIARKSIKSSTKIKKIDIPGLKQYQLALQAYKKKQSNIAMRWIDQALEKSFNEKYSILKARIFIQKKSAEDLFQYVLSQEKNTSLDWFKLVAPGLQMFGFYQLSNQYYTQLIKQQPKQVKWQLAKALNYLRLGQSDKSYAIYKNLTVSPVLSNQQRKWVLAKINRMESDKATINGN